MKHHRESHALVRTCVVHRHGGNRGAGLRRLIVLSLVCMAVGSPLLVAPTAHAATPTPSGLGGWNTGQPGFITRDGLFFIQAGADNFIGFFEPSYNGSQLYTYSVILNITSIVAANETARIHLYDYDTKSYLTNLTVPTTGYANVRVEIPLPTEHTWTEVRITVDGTAGYFYWETPYTWLPISNLANGGIVLSVVVAFGVYLWIAYPLAVKAERMTKRAVYAPNNRASTWLHVLAVLELGIYAAWFPQINSALHGFEVFLFPIPEAVYVFFWSAARHSRRVIISFDQPVTIPGRPLSWIERPFYGGIDPDGNIVIIPYASKSWPLWWYRSRGYQVAVWALFEDGRAATRLSQREAVRDTVAQPARANQHATPVEPLTMPVYDYESLTPEQVRDPTRLPRSGIYDNFQGAAILNQGSFMAHGGNVGEAVSFRFLVPNLSDFRVQWPSATLWSFETVQAYTDEGGKFHEAKKKRHFTPHITPGSAQVTLMSWHGQDVYAQSFNWQEATDLVEENDQLRAALWVARAQLHVESGRKAEEGLLANRDILERPYTDLEQEEIEELVERHVSERRDRGKPAPGDSGA